MSIGTRIMLEQLPEPYRSQAVRQLEPPAHGRPTDALCCPQTAQRVASGRLTREGNLQRACEAFLRARGCIVFHMPGRAAIGNFRGWPDLTVLCPGGRFLLVELKTARGKRSPLQTMFMERASSLGHGVHVVRSIGELTALYEGGSACQTP